MGIKNLCILTTLVCLTNPSYAEDALRVPNRAVELNCSLIKFNTDIGTGGTTKYFAFVQFQGKIPIPPSLDMSYAEDFWLDSSKEYLKVTALADIQTSSGLNRVIDNVIVLHDKGSDTITVGLAAFNETWVQVGDALGYEFETESAYQESIFDELRGCYLVP